MDTSSLNFLLATIPKTNSSSSSKHGRRGTRSRGGRELPHGRVDALGNVVDVRGRQPANVDAAALEQVDVVLLDQVKRLLLCKPDSEPKRERGNEKLSRKVTKSCQDDRGIRTTHNRQEKNYGSTNI